MANKMKQNPPVNKEKKGTGLAVVIGILSALLIILVIAISFKLLKGNKTYYYEAKDYYYQIKQGDYAFVTDNINRYRMVSKDDSEEYHNLVAMADYNVAIMRYYAAKSVNDEVKAAKYKDEAALAKEKMGVYSYIADNLDETIKAAAGVD